MEEVVTEYIGHVVDGVITLENSAALPEGTQVRVTVINADPLPPALKDVLLKYAGTIKDWPADFAAKHDHYLHGVPRETE